LVKHWYCRKLKPGQFPRALMSHLGQTQTSTHPSARSALPLPRDIVSVTGHVG